MKWDDEVESSEAKLREVNQLKCRKFVKAKQLLELLIVRMRVLEEQRIGFQNRCMGAGDHQSTHGLR